MLLPGRRGSAYSGVRVEGFGGFRVQLLQLVCWFVLCRREATSPKVAAGNACDMSQALLSVI